MRKIWLLTGILGMCLMGTLPSYALPDNVQIRGYVQGLPLRLSAEIPDMGVPWIDPGKHDWWEYRMQQRLNVRWDISSTWTFNWEMRTRLFAGGLVRDIPGYAAAIDTDDGLVNLSWMMVEQDDWFLHYIPDRLFLEWMSGDWSVRLGRQRVNWGVTTLVNPNDVFNIYSLYDFDYPERPGSDAIRIQRYTGFASRIEVAVRPARDIKEMVAAALYAFNTRGYDIQFISGYYREQLIIGGGWAGHLGQLGFKGEGMVFTGSGSQQDIDSGSLSPPQNTLSQNNIIAAVEIDHMFSNGLFLIAGFLFNKEGGSQSFSLIGESLRPDNPSFSQYQTTVMAQYAFNPLWDGALSAAWYPDENAVYLSPSITRSLATDLDLNVFGQAFIAGSTSVFATAGNVIAASLKYNF
ncbi:hypothetical protein QLX67_05385 [Balneolaceae bacterium ANBcel3]|nr:hypothetical protein [Balneolaceae bacterium ANBcel3]